MLNGITKETLQKVTDYYIGLGWSLLPMDFVKDGTDTVKRPMIPWKEFQTRKATKEEVYSWLDKNWSLGLVTGGISRLDVIDDDRIKAGLLPYGFQSLVEAKTKSGGSHYYFAHRPGIRNTANPNLHVDVRGEGGYVVLPPFFGYSWVHKPNRESLNKLIQIPTPDWEMIKSEGRNAGEYVDIKDLVNVEHGNRDNNMYRLGLRLCNRFPETEWDTALELLRAANLRYNPPLSDAVVVEKFKQAAGFVKAHPLDKQEERDAKRLAVETRPKFYSEMTDDELRIEKHRPRLPVGLSRLDSFFDFPSGYYVICANPGAGKGWFALWITRKFYELHQYKTIFFSLEMPEMLVRSRIKQAWSDLTQKEYEEGYPHRRALEMMKNDVVIVDTFSSEDQTLQTPELFKAKVEEYYKKGYRVFHFDHLHELEGANDNAKNQSVTEKWAKIFQELCKEKEDIWLFVFAQPNGAAAAKPVISRTDIAGSKAITQKCDFFISLNRKVDKDDDGNVIIDHDNRDVTVYLDKSRYTSISHAGAHLFFAHTGNFYNSKADFENATKIMAPDAVEKEMMEYLI